MKKTTRKLVLRRETIRELSAKALTHVIGGQETDAYPQTGPRQCLTVAAYPQSGPKQCLSADAYPQSRERQCPAAALDGVARDSG